MDDEGFDLEDELEDELREIAGLLDPVPPALLDDAMQAFTLRTLDTELAALTFDSWDEEPSTRVRGAGLPRLLTFEAGGVAVELEVFAARVVGRLSPEGPAEIDVQRRDEELRVRSDELGRFTAEGLTRGPLRLRVAPDGGAPIVTSWTRL
ncbi:hypothetical protein [Nonomuraea sp. NEAU-A123]|uniref:hypothetical protein n=1 Tax=Nonomuraea sp. NEAU-A123 TaxID=2839649 RepID=UPI001BE42CC8|nr:hypothetical protein [Nonomuraea sp. NEAU-A123]MBT2227483.1 hypothetical protein [Nonomuraea sp. NEAU-A123]